MIKRFKVLISLLLSSMLVLVSGCQSEFKAGNYTDDLGRLVRIEKAPQRIVSHVPSITETVFALGLGDKIVGRSDYDDYPPEAAKVPSIGDYFNPAIEKIVALEPDLVLTDGHSDTIKKLDDLKITLFTIDPKNINDIIKDLDVLGKMTATEKKAQEIINNMNQDVALVSNKSKSASKVRVFYAIDTTNPALPWTAGPGSFIDAFIQLSGGENVAAKAPGAWAQLSIEAIVAADPEVIIIPTKHGTAYTSIDSLKNNPAWKNITAVKNNNIQVVDADLMERTGPRITQGLKQLAQAIHPELYK